MVDGSVLGDGIYVGSDFGGVGVVVAGGERSGSEKLGVGRRWVLAHFSARLTSLRSDRAESFVQPELTALRLWQVEKISYATSSKQRGK